MRKKGSRHALHFSDTCTQMSQPLSSKKLEFNDEFRKFSQNHPKSMVWELKGGLLLAKESQKELSFSFFFSTFRSVSFSFCKRKNLKKYKLSPTSSNDCSIDLDGMVNQEDKQVLSRAIRGF